MMHSNAANRLDRLPISRFHKITLIAVSFAYFFEFVDINSFATTVPKLMTVWGVTINQIAYVTSLSFVGMFFGSLVASWLAERWGRKKALIITTWLFGAIVLALFGPKTRPAPLPQSALPTISPSSQSPNLT